jgi:hypothetical protein
MINIRNQDNSAALKLTNEMPMETKKISGGVSPLEKKNDTRRGSMFGSTRRRPLLAYHHSEDKSSPATAMLPA